MQCIKPTKGQYTEYIKNDEASRKKLTLQRRKYGQTRNSQKRKISVANKREKNAQPHKQSDLQN